ncbi:hypothetical protein D557_2213 [Bordetella holmesii 70147]|nr:hypothetical protein D555_2960 [Bordetella holmesii 35009]EWM49142.1 hypothetical protein D557_2213 [Bordetella holmesii 70147]
MNFTGDEFLGSGLIAAIVLLIAAMVARPLATTAALAAGTPAVTGSGGGSGLVSRLLARSIIAPGRGNLGRLDGLLAACSGCGLVGPPSFLGAAAASFLPAGLCNVPDNAGVLGAAGSGSGARSTLRGRLSISRKAAASASALRRASSRAPGAVEAAAARRAASAETCGRASSALDSVWVDSDLAAWAGDLEFISF